MTEHEDDGPELPEGFEKVEATVCRRGEELIVFGTLERGPVRLPPQAGAEGGGLRPAAAGLRVDRRGTPPEEGGVVLVGAEGARRSRPSRTRRA